MEITNIVGFIVIICGVGYAGYRVFKPDESEKIENTIGGKRTRKSFRKKN
jgi:hypothetical protein